MNSYIKIFHESKVDFPKFKERLHSTKSKSKAKNKHAGEKIQKLFKKLIPNLKEEDFFENKKDSIVYSYLMKNQTVIY